MNARKTGSQEGSDDALTLRPVRDGADAGRFATFNGSINGADQGATCAALLHHHPTRPGIDFILVEDEQIGEVASPTCAIPWCLQHGGVKLDALMLEKRRVCSVSDRKCAKTAGFRYEFHSSRLPCIWPKRA